MEGESSHGQDTEQTMQDDEETLDVTTMVTRIDSLESTMLLMMNNMEVLTGYACE